MGLFDNLENTLDESLLEGVDVKGLNTGVVKEEQESVETVINMDMDMDMDTDSISVEDIKASMGMEEPLLVKDEEVSKPVEPVMGEEFGTMFIFEGDLDKLQEFVTYKDKGSQVLTDEKGQVYIKEQHYVYSKVTVNEGDTVTFNRQEFNVVGREINLD